MASLMPAVASLPPTPSAVPSPSFPRKSRQPPPRTVDLFLYRAQIVNLFSFVGRAVLCLHLDPALGREGSQECAWPLADKALFRRTVCRPDLARGVQPAPPSAPARSGRSSVR